MSGLIDAVTKGETVTITRHGKPAAVLVSVETAETLINRPKTDFGSFLLTFPGGLDLERDGSPLRDVDL
jgi:prevent-host-death family protein